MRVSGRRWHKFVWRKGRAYCPTDCKELALKDPLKSDVCLMASENRAIVGEEVL